ncbi:MAG: OmpA family protein [Burkholderiales bacterium]
MSSQDDDSLALVGVILAGIVGLVIAGVIGLGIYKSRSKPQAAKPDAVLAMATALVLGNPANASADAASVQVENGVVKFYFASAKADLAAGANEVLAEVVKSVKSGRKAVISGFHDASGDAANNAELAKQRALAVRDALKALGVAEGSVELKKPEQTSAASAPSLARRVEVVVQ